MAVGAGATAASSWPVPTPLQRSRSSPSFETPRWRGCVAHAMTGGVGGFPICPRHGRVELGRGDPGGGRRKRQRRRVPEQREVGMWIARKRSYMLGLGRSRIADVLLGGDTSG